VQLGGFLEEIWRPVAGYESWYEVSNRGRVKTLARTVRQKYAHGWVQKKFQTKFLKLINFQGYRGVTLYGHNGPSRQSVHRLVALTFGIIRPDQMVNHIDGDKTNNFVSNLEPSNHLHNNRHAFRLGLNNKTGSAHHNAKLKEEDIPKVHRLRMDGLLMREIGEIFGVHKATISDVLKGKSWRHVNIYNTAMRGE